MRPLDTGGADLRELDSKRWCLWRTTSYAGPGILFQGQVWPDRIVVIEVLTKKSSEMASAKDDHMVRALSTC